MKQTLIALLRGINVGGHKKVPMADLRTLASAAGFTAVQTYIQSGNLVFDTDMAPEAARDLLGQAIRTHFGFPVDVALCSADQWRVHAAGSPFPEAETERPNLLHLGLGTRAVTPHAAEALAKYATAGEQITVSDGALWIDFPSGVARSKITPVAIDRAAGCPVTLRNWRTVQQLAVMSSAG